MALTDEQLELLGNKLVPLYQELEQNVIADIARRVKKTGRYTETAELMTRALMEQGYSPARIQREVVKLLRADKEYQMAVAEHTKEYKQYVAGEIFRVVVEAKEQGNSVVAEAGIWLSMQKCHCGSRQEKVCPAIWVPSACRCYGSANERRTQKSNEISRL